MDKEVVVTDTTEKSEEMIPQTQVSGLVAKEIKKAQEKLLKELGVEDVTSAKEGLTKFKEIQESQKSETQKIIEENERLKNDLSGALNQVKQSKIEKATENILSELEIDTKYAKTLLKLADLSKIEDVKVENIKPILEKTLEEELPMLLKKEIKIGTEKTVSKQVTTGTKDYLDKKYGKNPYYKK